MRTISKDPSDVKKNLSRSGRVLRKTAKFTNSINNIRGNRGGIARFGKWTTKDKKRLLKCLKKFDCVHYSPLTVFRSLHRPKHEVVEYMNRLRRTAAEHTTKLRKKQPPILTWFQVADELTWLKGDGELYDAIGTLLGIFSCEANNLQDKNPSFHFSNLYRYLKTLLKDEELPKLTPAESLVLLDCFQDLADTLRASDTGAQASFMRSQYQRYFQLLYYSAESMAETRVRMSQAEKERLGFKVSDKVSDNKTQRAATNRKFSMRPAMKAELQKKQPKKRIRKRKQVEQPQGAVNEGDDNEGGVETELLIEVVVDEEFLQNNREGKDNLEPARGKSSQAGQGERPDIDLEACVETEPTDGSNLNETNHNSEEANMEHRKQEVRGQTLQAGRHKGSNKEHEGSGAYKDGEDNANNNNESHEKTGKEHQQSHDDIGSQSNHGNLDPNDPDFLEKFSTMFSLGSLNPFEIPTELMSIRPKTTDSEEDDEIPSESLLDADEVDLGQEDTENEEQVSVEEELLPGANEKASERQIINASPDINVVATI